MKKMPIMKRVLAMALAVASLTLTACDNTNNLVPNEANVGLQDKNYGDVYVDNNRHWYAYDFGTHRNYGDTRKRGDNIEFEGYQGIRLDTSDGNIRYAVYNHSEFSSNKDIKVDLYKYDDNDKFVKTLAIMSISDGEIDSEWKTVDENLEDGLYRINSQFLYIKDDSYDNISGYVIIRNGKAETCRLTYDRRKTYSEKFANLVEENGKDPSKFLSNKDNTYPTNGYGDYCVHVKEWEQQADEIIKEKHLENATDEAKVFFFEEWLAKNIAYDRWRVSKNDNKSRANYYSDWSNDNLFSYYNHVGQCWDFVNMMAIMCRHVGIPCTDVANSGHTISCVYMNDEWVCIDITIFTKYTNWEEVPDPDKFVEGEWEWSMHDWYGCFPDNMYEWEACIWTSKNNGTK